MQTVLLVGGRPDTRLTHELSLRRAGFDVRTVDDGAGAIGLDQVDRCAVILIDSVLTDMSGADLCRTLRETRALTVPILLVGSMADERLLSEGFRAGASGYMVRPNSPRELIERVCEFARA